MYGQELYLQACSHHGALKTLVGTVLVLDMWSMVQVVQESQDPPKLRVVGRVQALYLPNVGILLDILLHFLLTAATDGRKQRVLVPTAEEAMGLRACFVMHKLLILHSGSITRPELNAKIFLKITATVYRCVFRCLQKFS